MKVDDLLAFAEAVLDMSGFDLPADEVEYYFSGLDMNVITFEWDVFPGFLLRLELKRDNGEVLKGPTLVREADEQA